MMKFTLFAILAFSLNSVVIAKKQMKDFNKAMQDEISGFVKHNPEKYETKNPKDLGRKPASVEPVGINNDENKEVNEDTFHKMNQFDNQGIGLPKW